MLLVTSRKVIARAIEKGELQNLEQFKTSEFGGGLFDWGSEPVLAPQFDTERTEKLTTEIIESLVVMRDAARPGVSPSNEVLNLSYRGRDASAGPQVLNAVIASYQEFLRDTYRNTNAETLELISQARTTVQKDLAAKEAAYQKFLASTPPLWKTQDRSTAQQDRLFKIDGKLAALRMRRSEIEASIEIIDKATASGRNPTVTVLRLSAPADQGGAVAGNAAVKQEPWFAKQRPGINLEEELVALHLQHAKLRAVHSTKHPEVQAVARQMQAVRRMILPATVATGAEQDAVIVEDDLASIKVELFKQELDDLKIAEQALARLFDNEQKAASQSHINEIQDEVHRKGIERDRLLYESILNRLKETSTVKDFGGYNTQVIGPALPGRLALKKYAFVFGACLFCGLLAGFGWACFAEMLGKRSVSPSVSA
jgi:uncharacterized protein involved in exopolysaccharide biosynthesis